MPQVRVLPHTVFCKSVQSLGAESTDAKAH